MNHIEFLKNNYSDIIRGTLHRGSDDHDVILFDKFLEKIFPNLNAFIPFEVMSNIRSALMQKYGNDSNCVKEYGILKKVNLAELKYYQQEVGINGPRNTNIDEPIYVINYGNETILLNGYHRVLFHILDDKLEINSYTLTVNI